MNNVSNVVSTFELFNYSDEPGDAYGNKYPGVDNLDPGLTINSTTVYPTYRYKGGDANDTDFGAWDYGSALSIVEDGDNPSYNQGSPLLGSNDNSVKFNTGGYYEVTDTALGDIGTDDFVVEIIAKFPDSALTEVLIMKRAGPAPDPFWTVQAEDSGNFRILFNDGTTTEALDTLPSTPNVWYHLLLFVNRDEASGHGGWWYVNGQIDGNGDMSSAQDTLSNVGDFTFGARNSGDLNYSSNIAYIAMWHQADWHQAGASGSAEWATIAKERFCKLTGIWPQIAGGTAAPEVLTRSSPSYIDKLEGASRKLYFVGDEWLRCVYRQDSLVADAYGYLPEQQLTNLVRYSEDFSDPAWNTISCIISADAIEAPNKATTADAIVGDINETQHGIQQTITLTDATYSFSTFAKSGTQSQLFLQITDLEVDGYFDLDAGTIGTTGAEATAYIENWGDGWHRCVLVFTGKTTQVEARIFACESDLDGYFAGDTSNNIYVWGAQVEQSDYMTSYILTEGSTTTRLADKLRYKGDDGNLGGVGSDERGTAFLDIMIGDIYDGTNYTVFELNDDGKVGDKISMHIYHGRSPWAEINDETIPTVANTGTNVFRNNTNINHLRLLWEENNVKCFVNGSEEISDTSCTIPDDLDRIDIGTTRTGNQGLNGIISNFQIYNDIVDDDGFKESMRSS